MYISLSLYIYIYIYIYTYIFEHPKNLRRFEPFTALITARNE